MMWLDWLIVAIPMCIIVAIGIISERYIRSVSDFLAAGRKAGRYLLTVSDGTAGLGLISVIAVFENNYKAGYALGFWNNLAILVGLAMTLTGFVTYRFRETRSLTMPEFFQKRYSRGFRIYAGILAFISGLINYALFPAVGGRFLIYYCGLPFSVTIFGITMPTFGVLMAIFLGIALIIVLAGGQITTMVTDCCQGIFAYFGYTIIVITLLCIFNASDVSNAMLSRPEGMSFFNPFNVSKLTHFNILFIFIGMFGSIYGRNAWLGSQAYQASAASPHEQKMAGVLGQWRGGFQTIALMLLVIGAYTYLNTNTYVNEAAAVTQEVTARAYEDLQLSTYQPDSDAYRFALHGAETIKNQMLVPVALRHILPIGVTGIFCALMVFLMVSTDTTYMHSWGTIFIQDVILPIRNKPISAKSQMRLLRLAIFGIAVFAWFFSFYFQQGDFILQFFAMTGTIFLGGAGAVILGGLYSKRGTTAGAYTAMTVGLFFAILGFTLQQFWASSIFPKLNVIMPNVLEGFRVFLEKAGNALFFVQWETDPEKFAMAFPITGQEFWFLGMLSALTGYWVVSFLTYKKPFNLEQLLHRGQYNLEHFVSASADKKLVQKTENKKWDWRILLGITPEYSKGDRILAWSVLIWTLYNFTFFAVQAIWNLPPEWRWSEKTWFNIWLYYTLPQSLLVGIVTTVWFTWGGLRDLTRLFKSLREQSQNAASTANDDNGQTLTK